MFKTSGLYRQLSSSHLFVTVLTAVSLALCILLGYWFYISSGRAALWVANNALIDASYIASDHDYAEQVTLDSDITHYYLDNMYFPYVAPERRDIPLDEDPDAPEFYAMQVALVVSPRGDIVASNFQKTYPVGERIQDLMPPGFRTSWLEHQGKVTTPNALLRSTVRGNLHIGFAPIVNENATLLGWVYLHHENDTTSQMLRSITQTLLLGLLGAGVIAVLVSALVGNRLAKALSHRLSALSQLSRSYASGDLSQRYGESQQDEIGQLGQQFNTMAAQIERQMLELRELVERNTQLAEKSKALAVLEERNRLARELHDAVKQQLFGLNLTLGAVKQLLKTQPDVASTQLENASQLAAQTLGEMDTIIKQLRPVSLERKDLAAALQELLKQWSAQASIKTQFDVRGEDALSLAHEQCLYRITQEGLQNVAKHADAKMVKLELVHSSNEVTLRLSDNGKGFDTSQESLQTLGLRSMKERAEALGGTLQVQSGKHGTQLSVTLPLEQPNFSERPSHV